MLRAIFLLLFTLCVLTSEAREAVVRSQAEVFSAPKGSAEKITVLSRGDSVETGERRGLWVEVVKPMAGWVKLRQLTMASAGKTSSSLSGLQSGREGAGNAVSASGVRGLDSEMIKLSDPDPIAVEEFKTFMVVSVDAIRFAKSRSLDNRDIAYLPDPESQRKKVNKGGAEKVAPDQAIKKHRASKKKKRLSDDDW